MMQGNELAYTMYFLLGQEEEGYCVTQTVRCVLICHARFQELPYLAVFLMDRSETGLDYWCGMSESISDIYDKHRDIINERLRRVIMPRFCAVCKRRQVKVVF